VAHIFNRIYQSEGDVRCRDAALQWFDRTLKLRRPDSGIGGYQALKRVNGDSVWESSPSFLDGAVGIGLALLAGLTSITPSWDRLLLVSGCAL
jgi:hypothetical protein